MKKRTNSDFCHDGEKQLWPDGKRLLSSRVSDLVKRSVRRVSVSGLDQTL